jgi:hypothetical protein
MKILLLTYGDVGGYYAASLMERGHQCVMHGGGAPIFAKPGEFTDMVKEYLGCDACLLIGNDPELLEIADHFEDTGKPLWRDLAQVPRSDSVGRTG